VVRSAALSLGLVVALVGVGVPTASASCRSKIGAHAHVVVQTRSAVVYRRVEHPPDPSFGDQPIYRGCEFRTGKLRRLNDFGNPAEHLGHWTLAGRYVAFTRFTDEGASAEVMQRLDVYDLREGSYRLRLRPIASGTPQSELNEIVRSLVMKPNGSIAWIASFNPQSGPAESYQVSEVEMRSGDARTKLDEGPAIRPRSLALSDDRKTVYWRSGADVRAARLR
jgi:hypothetical protein